MNNRNEYNRKVCRMDDCDIEIGELHTFCKVHEWLAMLTFKLTQGVSS